MLELRRLLPVDSLAFPVELHGVIVINILPGGLGFFSFVGVKVCARVGASHDARLASKLVVTIVAHHSSPHGVVSVHSVTTSATAPATSVEATVITSEVVATTELVTVVVVIPAKRIVSITIVMVATSEVVVGAGRQNARVLILLQLQDEIFSRHLLEVPIVKSAHKTVVVLVLDVLDDEVGGAESFLADDAHVLAALVDQTCLLNAVLVFLLDKDLVFLRV